MWFQKMTLRKKRCTKVNRGYLEQANSWTRVSSFASFWKDLIQRMTSGIEELSLKLLVSGSMMVISWIVTHQMKKIKSRIVKPTETIVCSGCKESERTRNSSKLWISKKTKNHYYSQTIQKHLLNLSIILILLVKEN